MIGYVVPLLERAVGMPISLCRIPSVVTDGAEDMEVFANHGIDSVGVYIDEENAPSRSSKGGQFVMANRRHLPLTERVFDCILTIEVIEHVGQERREAMRRTEREKFVSEPMRVCRKGGAILLSVPNKKFPINLAHAGMDRNVVGGPRIGVLH
jgi:SAM-dependent methyltransferase